MFQCVQREFCFTFTVFPRNLVITIFLFIFIVIIITIIIILVIIIIILTFVIITIVVMHIVVVIQSSRLSEQLHKSVQFSPAFLHW